MLRFPNPGSTISNFISVYTAAFNRLNGYVVDLDDIFQTYGLSIGVIDLRSLVMIAARTLVEGVTISPRQLCTLRGFLDV
jgi:hypothetical protein